MTADSDSDASRGTPPTGGDASRGAAWLAGKGCLGCHALDERPMVGPSLGQFWTRPRMVVVDGKPRSQVGTAAYLRRAVEQPAAELVDGYAGGMPAYKLTDAELLDLGAALAAPSGADARVVPPPPNHGALPHVLLAAGALAFVFGHLIPSSTSVRRWLIARLGEGVFLLAYALLAFASLGALIAGYRLLPFTPLWSPPAWTRWIPFLGMPVVYVLLVAGFTTKSPTVAGQTSALDAEGGDRPVGIVRITRHPSLWAFGLWGVLHLTTNGDLGSMTLFAAVVALAFAGMLHIDARRAKSNPAGWARFAEQTSLLPFAALARARQHQQQRSVLAEVGLVRPLVGLGGYVAMLFLHGLLFGVVPWP